jgi:putative ABC transport system substrate-binding protein
VNIGRRIALVTILLIFLFSFRTDISAQELSLAIVYSDSLTATLRTLRGISSSIEGKLDNVRFHEYLLSSSPDEISNIISEINSVNPKLILTIGSYATQEISAGIKDKPIIFSAVLNPETSGFVKSKKNPGGNITGASLDIPPQIQYTYFKRVIDKLKKIGVLYSDETANLIPPARAVAQEAGLELVAIKIDSEKDIPDALEKLERTSDGIWSVADKNIFSPRSTKYILLNTLRNGVPFMGFSRNLVESGALFALDFDYKDIGRQAGKIALEVLSGGDPASISVEVPGIIWFHYNEKTAKHINVEIPADLVAIAKEVYR